MKKVKVVLKEYPEINYELDALLDESGKVIEYVAAFGPMVNGEWQQGHYFNDIEMALMFINSRKDEWEQRKDIVMRMHSYIIYGIGDDYAYEDWVTNDVPDEPNEEDFNDFTNAEVFSQTCKDFAKIVKGYCYDPE